MLKLCIDFDHDTTVNLFLNNDPEVFDGCGINNKVVLDSRKQASPSCSVVDTGTLKANKSISVLPKNVKAAHPQTNEDCSFQNLFGFTVRPTNKVSEFIPSSIGVPAQDTISPKELLVKQSGKSAFAMMGIVVYSVHFHFMRQH